MSDAAMEKILDSGSLEDIDALLSKFEEGVSDEEALAAVESSDTGTVTAAPAAAAPVEPTPVQNSEQAPGILAKDNKNIIPFSVLEQERREAANLKSQLEEFQRKNALLEEQLTANNIQPKVLPEHIRFTPEQLAEYESYGEIGEAVAILAQQNAALQEQMARMAQSPGAVSQPQTSSNPMENNPDTLRWAGNDAHWSVVEAVNSVLDSDPDWMGKSTSERIPEIVRRTKLTLGEEAGADVTATAQAAIAAAQRVAPNSLTDVGGEVPGQTKTVVQMLEDGDAADVAAYLEKATAGGKSMDEVLSALLV